MLRNFIMSLGLALMACVVQMICNRLSDKKIEINGAYLLRMFGLFVVCFFIFNLMDLV